MSGRNTLAEEIAKAAAESLTHDINVMGCITYSEEPELKFRSYSSLASASESDKWSADFHEATSIVLQNLETEPLGEIDSVYFLQIKHDSGVSEPPSPLLDSEISKMLGLEFIELSLIDIRGSVHATIPVDPLSKIALPMYEFSTQSRIENYMRSKALMAVKASILDKLQSREGRRRWLDSMIIESSENSNRGAFYLKHALND